jgi:hypothetical protein
VAAELGIKMLLYEAGEGLRFDELSIRAGVRGVLQVMRELEMLPQGKRGQACHAQQGRTVRGAFEQLDTGP